MSDFNGQLSNKTFNGEEFISWNKHHKFLNLMNKIKKAGWMRWNYKANFSIALGFSVTSSRMHSKRIHLTFI